MNPTLPLIVLLAASSGAPKSPASALTDAEQRALSGVSQRWSVRFELAMPDASGPASGGSRSRALSYSAEVAEQIEARLAAARTALGSADVIEAAAALEAAERLLREHPELPQAAWWRAEQLSLQADVAVGTDAAESLREAALVLEGPRAVPFDGNDDAAQRRNANDVPVRVSVNVLGPAWNDQLEWDGVRMTTPFSTLAGEHVARVLRDEVPIWAGWVVVSDQAPAAEVELGVPRPRACSLHDLGGTRAGHRRPIAAPRVLCARWAVARRLSGGLEVALCRRSRCGDWQRAESEPLPAPVPRREGSASERFPTWATVALASAGALLATSVVLWQTGAFESSERTRFVYGGFERR